MDAVQKANSGHPGAPMGMAATAYILWDRFLKHNPQNPQWINRDRFILSPGHASTLTYIPFYILPVMIDLPLDELKKNSGNGIAKLRGIREYGITPGVEATTGPAGQGGSLYGIGMAIAEKC
jgi:transketolase